MDAKFICYPVAPSGRTIILKVPRVEYLFSVLSQSFSSSAVFRVYERNSRRLLSPFILLPSCELPRSPTEDEGRRRGRGRLRASTQRGTRVSGEEAFDSLGSFLGGLHRISSAQLASLDSIRDRLIDLRWNPRLTSTGQECQVLK
jgi:hypothetical protein